MSAPASLSHSESPFDSIRQARPDGTEFWSARDLMAAMTYPTWQHFRPVVERAMASTEGAGQVAAHHFTVNRETPRMGGPAREDFDVTRYGAYLIAMNGDPRKPAVAAGQTYFAVKTREAEVAPAKSVAELTRRDLALMLIAAEDELDAANARAEVAEAQVAEVAPKVELAENFLNSRPNGRLVREVAKELGVQEKWLRAFLLSEGLIFLRHATCGVNVYDFKAEFRPHFEAREKVVDHSFGTCSHYTLFITPRGVDLIRKRMKFNRLAVVS